MQGVIRSADLQVNTDATGQDTSDRRQTDALPKDTDDESRAADKNQAAYQSREVDRSAEGFAQPCEHPGRDEPSYARSRDPTAETLENGLPVPEFCIAKADYSSLGSGYLRLSKGKEVQVLMKGSEEDGEDAVGWFFGRSCASGPIPAGSPTEIAIFLGTMDYQIFISMNASSLISWSHT